jgi:predicted kinase
VPNLIILAGLPGSGKSTWAEEMFGLKYRVVSSDKIRIQGVGSLRDAHDANKPFNPWPKFYQEITDALRMGVDVVADATFLTPKHRDQIREVAASVSGVKTTLVLFMNLFEAITRNAARDEETKVPVEVMDGMKDLYYTTLAQVIQERYDRVMRISSYA